MTFTCKRCGRHYARLRAPRHICHDCRDELHAMNQIWCVACEKVTPITAASQRERLVYCRPCHAERNQRYRARNGRRILSQTLDERNAIAVALEQGCSREEAARMIGVPVCRVNSTIDYGWAETAVPRSQRHREHSHWMHSGEIRDALGWSPGNWLSRRKYLPLMPYGERHDSHSGKTIPAVYIVEGEQLYDWCADRMSWMLWRLEDCSMYWQRTLAVMRPPGSIDWLYVGDAARMLGYTRVALRQYEAHADHPLAMVLRGGTTWIWPPDVVAWAQRRGIHVPQELRALAAPVASPEARRRAIH